MGDRTDEVLTVVAVVGMPRSGSTIVSRLLGEADGADCIGEVRQLWWNLDADPDHRCGCGEPLTGCPFWTQVFDRIGFDGSPDALRRRIDTQEQALRRHHPWLGLPSLLVRRKGTLPPRSRPYAAELADLFRAVADASGASVVIDSSKKSEYAALLGGVPGVRVHIVHTLRDPRATLMSHNARRHADAPSASYPVDALRRSASWLLETIGALVVCRGRASTRIEYEAFAAAPREELTAVLEAVGVDPSSLTVDDSGQALVGVSHTVGGSPTRFDTGPVAIRSDDRWRTQLNTRDRRLTELVTAPLWRLRSPR